MNIHRSPPPPLHFSPQPQMRWLSVPTVTPENTAPLENTGSPQFISKMEEQIFNTGFPQGPKPVPAFEDTLVFLEASFKISTDKKSD